MKHQYIFMYLNKKAENGKTVWHPEMGYMISTVLLIGKYMLCMLHFVNFYVVLNFDFYLSPRRNSGKSTIIWMTISCSELIK